MLTRFVVKLEIIDLKFHVVDCLLRSISKHPISFVFSQNFCLYCSYRMPQMAFYFRIKHYQNMYKIEQRKKGVTKWYKRNIYCLCLKLYLLEVVKKRRSAYTINTIYCFETRTQKHTHTRTHTHKPTRAQTQTHTRTHTHSCRHYCLH